MLTFLCLMGFNFATLNVAVSDPMLASRRVEHSLPYSDDTIYNFDI